MTLTRSDLEAGAAVIVALALVAGAQPAAVALILGVTAIVLLFG